MGCKMVYSFSGKQVAVDAGRIIVFWGAAPHGVVSVAGSGRIVNIYVSLAQILRWNLPEAMVGTLAGGAVIAARTAKSMDQDYFLRWSEDYQRETTAWRGLLRGEIEMRLRRLALEGYDVLLAGTSVPGVEAPAGIAMRHVERMLRYISENFAAAICVPDVANHVNLSPSHTMALFRKTVGVPIKAHINRTRISHAQMMLANTDNKIITVAMESGFNSLSSFYSAFQAHEGMTPAAFRRAVRY